MEHAGSATFAVLLALSASACRGNGCTRERALPALADGTRVPVEIDAPQAPTLARALLDRVPPDFVEDERKGWRLWSLVGQGIPNRAVTVEADDAHGQRVMLAQPADFAAGREPIVAVNREGELRMALGRADDEDFFATFAWPRGEPWAQWGAGEGPRGAPRVDPDAFDAVRPRALRPARLHCGARER